MDARTAMLVAEYRRQREALIAQFPELEEDGDTLADTLEGVTEAPDLISRFVRDAREDEAMADALAGMMKDMGERKQRLSHRASRRRDAALAIMQAMDLRKLEQADFTASIRAVPVKVEIEDEALLPDAYCKFVRTPDKSSIREAIMSDAVVPGARLSNGGETLAIRSK
jgi:hypothetical protein